MVRPAAGPKRLEHPGEPLGHQVLPLGRRRGKAAGRALGHGQVSPVQHAIGAGVTATHGRDQLGVSWRVTGLAAATYRPAEDLDHLPTSLIDFNRRKSEISPKYYGIRPQ